MKTDFGIRKILPYVIIFIIVLLLELFVFNWRFFDSINYTSTDLTDFEIGSGIEWLGDTEIKVKEKGNKWIEFDLPDIKVDNVYLNISDKRNDDDELKRNGISHDYESISVTLSITDEANAEYMNMPERVISEGVERSKYIKLHTAGVSDKLKIKFNGVDNQTIEIKGISINSRVPFSAKPLRMLFVYAVLAILYTLRFGSPVYKISFVPLSRLQLLITTGVVVLNIVLGCVFCLANPKFIDIEIQHHKQYARLADSFINGHVYLDYEEPPQALIDMENPYDNKERSKVMKENGVRARWDHAYFNGKYYVYFGVLPVLVYYLPCKLATGMDFSTYMGVLINVSLYILFAFLLVRALAKRYFKELPFVSVLLMSQVLASSSGIIFAIRKPDLYAMPITMAMMLVTAGLWLWITADSTSKRILQGVALWFGSFFMASVALCRPQFLIDSFLAIPLFWGKVFNERELFSKKSIGRTIAFVMPYMIFAGAAMWYNNARFGSPFDFGANYNLTTNDMTRRGMNLGRLPLGLYAYFAQLPAFNARFPFLKSVDISNCYMGTTISELMFGGILATQPVLWCLAFVKNVKTELKQKGILAFVACTTAFSVLVASADTQMAGILYRYYMDYSYLMLIGAVLVAFTLIEKYGKLFTEKLGQSYGNVPVFVTSALALACLGYNLMAVLVSGDYSYEFSSPNFYYGIVSALAFWL